ncbi:MAG TPA: hypothetical protein VK909_14310 [Anaerolineales bacterium]|nr:hypothetical protein [Anaerolineales bacterium]
MEAKKSKQYLYLKQFMKSHNIDQTQLAIIFGFLVIATLASLWLPMYVASMILQGV